MRMSSYVYFIKDEKSNAVKIGKANDIEVRLSELQVGNPNKLNVINYIECLKEEDAKYIEKVLHQKYKELRIQGEWFIFDEKFLFEQYDKHIELKTKGKRSALVVNTLFGTEERFGINETPRCYFYPELMAQIMQSYEVSLNLKNPYRTMEWPTNGKQMLLPFSTDVNRVFISSKKHNENIEYNDYQKKKNNTTSLVSFFG